MTREQWDKLPLGTQYTYAELMRLTVVDYMRAVGEETMKIEGHMPGLPDELRTIYGYPREVAHPLHGESELDSLLKTAREIDTNE